MLNNLSCVLAVGIRSKKRRVEACHQQFVHLQNDAKGALTPKQRTERVARLSTGTYASPSGMQPPAYSGGATAAGGGRGASEVRWGDLSAVPASRLSRLRRVRGLQTDPISGHAA